jgi:AcrR family transcriptional regulator
MAPDPRVTRTRARVLAAAWELLNEVGFEGITVELVSERSGVARSTMYRHWRSMPEVLRDAFAEQAGQRPPSADADDGLSALTAYAQAVAVGLTQVWGRAAASLAGSALGDPEQKAVQRVFVDGTRRDLREIVDIGRQTGELDASTDPGALVDRLLDLVIAPLFYRYMFTDRPVNAEQAAALAGTAWAVLRRSPS